MARTGPRHNGASATPGAHRLIQRPFCAVMVARVRSVRCAMAATAEKTDPKLWDKIKRRVTRSDKGGQPGQWSARKAQLATQEYKKAGGGYRGKKAADNHLQQWQYEEWGTKSGKKSLESGDATFRKRRARS
jgi:hypothetical protein